VFLWCGRANPDPFGGEKAKGDFVRSGADAEGVVVVAREGREGDAGADADVVEELEKAFVALVKTCNDDSLTSGSFREGKKAAALELRGSFRKHAIAVWTLAFLTEALNELGLEGGGDDVLEALGFGVNLVPFHAEDFGEHALDEVMAEGGAMRGFAAFRGELERAVGGGVDVAVFAETAKGLGDSRRGDPEPLGEEGRDDGVAFALSLNDGLEVVLFGDGDFCCRHS